MNFTRRALTKIALLQALSAVVACTFIYLQMCLISDLEHEIVNGRLALLTAVTLVLSIALELFEAYSRGHLFATFSAEVKGRTARAFLRKPVQAHGMKSNEEHMAFFLGKVDTVLNQYFYIGLYGMNLMLQFGATVVTLFVISWQCGLAVTTAAVGFGAVIRFLSGKMAEKQGQLQEKKAVFVDTLTELYEGYEEIHLNQMEALAEENFLQANQEVEKTLYDYRLTQLGAETLGIGQNMFIYILILIVGGGLAYGGLMGLGLFVSAAELSVQALNQWSMLSRIRGKMKGVEQLKKELDVYVQEASEQDTFSEFTDDGDTLLEVWNLHFRYNEETPLLEGVNLRIHRGEHFLFQGTLRQNLVFDQEVAEGVLYEILQKLELDLPLDWMIEEEGTNLSGGQRARVVLARALLAKPDLLVTDELTANLDSALGRKIEEMLLTEYPKMAWCAVAHRTYCPERYDAQIKLGKQQMGVCQVQEVAL